MGEQRKPSAHKLTVSERSAAQITAVCEILRFDEESVLLELDDGKLSIDGEGLTLVGFCRESGEVTVNGKISAMSYSEKHVSLRSGGFFTRLFGYVE